VLREVYVGLIPSSCHNDALHSVTKVTEDPFTSTPSSTASASTVIDWIGGKSKSLDLGDSSGQGF
jgi:hypothetical protein